MKKIYSFLLVVAAFIAFAPNMRAQTITDVCGNGTPLVFPNAEDNPLVIKKNVGLRKDISEPVNGKYWLKLEAFATGSAVATTSSVPSDIILLLDTSSSMTESYNGSTRIAELRKAVAKFAGSIYENAVASKEAASDYPGNRIAIITYNRTASLVTSRWVTMTGDPATDNSLIHPDASAPNGYAGSLITTISEIGTGSGTRPDRALRYAIEQLLDGSHASKREGANLTVLLFTDGYPTDEVGSNLGEPRQDRNKFDLAFANNTLHYASKVKQQYSARLYTVGLISTPGANTGADLRRNYYRVLQMMEWVSSNWPKSQWETNPDPAVEGYNLNFDVDITFNSTSSTQVHTGNDVPAPFRNAWTVNSDNSITLDNFDFGDASDVKDSNGNLMFQRSVADYSTLPNGWQLYRRLLAAQPDHSVSIVSIGFVTCLAQLLQSLPDCYSSLDGVELVRRKVKCLYLMGGVFGESEEPDFNLSQGIGFAKTFFQLWPRDVDIVFSPMEVGQEIEYTPEQVINDIDWTDVDPIKQIYMTYNCRTGQKMWDPLLVINAVEGDSLFALSPRGTVTFTNGGGTLFSPSPAGNIRYQLPGDAAWNAAMLERIRTFCVSTSKNSAAFQLKKRSNNINNQ